MQTPQPQPVPQEKPTVPLIPPTLLPPMPNHPEQDFFRYRIDSGDIIEELYHQLRGEVWNPTEKRWKQLFDQELSDEGINELLGIVYSLGINKNTILGCLTHDEIYERCNSIWKELSLYFVLNGNRIKLDKDRRSILLKKLVYIIHSGLSRSELGREADQLSTATQRVEHYLDNANEKKKSINPLGFFAPKTR